MRSYHTGTNRRTWIKGTGVWVPSCKETRGYLPSQKGLVSCPPKEDFSFPPKGSGIPNLQQFSHFIDLGVLGEGSGVVKPPGLSRAQGATSTHYLYSCQRLDLYA